MNPFKHDELKSLILSDIHGLRIDYEQFSNAMQAAADIVGNPLPGDYFPNDAVMLKTLDKIANNIATRLLADATPHSPPLKDNDLIAAVREGADNPSARSEDVASYLGTYIKILDFYRNSPFPEQKKVRKTDRQDIQRFHLERFETIRLLSVNLKLPIETLLATSEGRRHILRAITTPERFKAEYEAEINLVFSEASLRKAVREQLRKVAHNPTAGQLVQLESQFQKNHEWHSMLAKMNEGRRHLLSWLDSEIKRIFTSKN